MTAATTAATRSQMRLLAAFLVGGAVSLSLGIYANSHDPTGQAIFTLFFTGTINLKAWFTTVALVLAAFQLFSAMRMYGKINFPATTPSWLGDAHRLSGIVAFVFTLPVAYHCLWSLGFESDVDQTRRFVHSLLGCFFYGAFAIKVLAVRSHKLPSWVLPVVGGAVFTGLVGLWYTSAGWFFREFGFPSV